MNTKTRAENLSSGCCTEKAPHALSWLWRDRVVLTLLVAMALLASLDPQQAATTAGFTLTSLWHMAPFLLLALALAAYTKASGADSLIAGAFSGHAVKAICLAAVVGAFSPFCSCGVIPLIAALLASGVPLAPVMAFWIASPIMDPEMFIITAAGIGLDFAIAKTAATVFMGLLAGFSVLALTRLGHLGSPARGSSAGGCSSTCTPPPKVPEWRFWRDPQRLRLFRDEALEIGGFLGKWLALAFFIESLMLAWLPADAIAAVVSGEQWFAIPLSAIVGVPAYLNGYAAVPLVAGLMQMGMSEGAAMAFVTAGAVSSIPAALAVYALVRLPVFLTYLGLGLVGAVLSGIGYQLISAV